MKIRIMYVFACMAYATIVNAADSQATTLQTAASEASRLLPRPTHAYSVDPTTAVGTTHHTPLNEQTVIEVRTILSQDYRDNVQDLVRTRWFFRKATNYTEGFSNALLYIGSGSSAIAAAGSLIFPVAVPYILFGGATCFAMHLTLAGLARCSAREEGEREHLLKELADTVGFKVVNLQPTVVVDEAAEPSPASAAARNTTA
jgi:hypothetical protein